MMLIHHIAQYEQYKNFNSIPGLKIIVNVQQPNVTKLLCNQSLSQIKVLI